MRIDEYEQYDATGLAELVRNAEVTPGELLELAIAQVESRDGELNAVVHRMDDEARSAVLAGLPQGPFTGVPFMIKDLIAACAGVPTTNGSRIFRDFVPDHDSTLIERYRAAGLVIMAKTNTPELGVAATTEPALHGSTRNPWRLECSPGGSSGGAAAAVAAGYLPMAHATDGGGSIRIPASNCGLFGLKPSRGRNPFGPDVGEGLAGMATGHCVSWSVRDSAALLDATAGPAPGDPYAAPALIRPLVEELHVSPGRLRIALCRSDFEGNPVDGDAESAVEEAARLMESLGHHVEEARPDFAGLSLMQAWRVIPAVNLLLVVNARARALGREPAPGDVEPVTWEWMQLGRRLGADDYMAAVAQMHQVGRRLGEFLTRYDLLMSPTLGRPTLPLGVMDMNTTDVEAFVQLVFGEVAPFTTLFNQSGGAAMSVPLGSTADGMPVGIQFGGTLGCEPLLIRLAAQLEQARPWRGRRPDRS
jgi:amidase/6-aminohexanoate-cyclic-dimer hydrolase